MGGHRRSMVILAELAIVLLWCLGVALIGLWLWVWWAAALATPQWIGGLDFNYYGEGIWEGVLLHALLVLLLGYGVWWIFRARHSWGSD